MSRIIPRVGGLYTTTSDYSDSHFSVYEGPNLGNHLDGCLPGLKVGIPFVVCKVIKKNQQADGCSFIMKILAANIIGYIHVHELHLKALP